MRKAYEAITITKNLRVLILEDDAWFAESLAKMLSCCHSGLDPESSNNKSPKGNETNDWMLKVRSERCAQVRNDNENCFDIKIINNPEKVFDIIEIWRPVVLVADVVLGAKNLFVLLHEMQSYVDTREISIVILSSISQQFDATDLEKFNVQKVLDKAKITPDVLRQTLHEIAKKTERQNE